jgi:signal transduction histidine kinase
MEYRLRSHDGEFRWILDIGVPRVNTDGSFAGYIGSCVDVNEHKRVEQALIQSEQLKASILDSLSNHIIVVNSRGIVVAVNYAKFDFAAGSSLLGLQVGTNYFEICRRTIGDNPEVTMALEGIESVFDGKRDYFELEFALPSATQPASLLMSVTPLKGPDRGIVISHHDITERRRHEEAIQDLSGRLINAQEQERSRIARELHDDINQQLAVLAIELQQLQDFFPEDSLRGRRQVQALWKKTLGLSTDLQHLSHQLHSTKLEHLGITAALRGLCGEFSEQHKIGADFQFRQVPPKLDAEISLHLFRVAQESLHNVAKHSRAKMVRMELVGADAKIVLRVSDDGIGFDPDAPKHQTGLGMTSMSERIRFVGGVLSIWSRPSMGTQVEATIPLSGRPAAVNRTSESALQNVKIG